VEEEEEEERSIICMICRMARELLLARLVSYKIL